MAKRKPDEFTQSVKEDEYYKRVLEESEVNTRVTGKEPTKDNLSKEAERLSRLVAENSNSKAITDVCNPLLEQARGLLTATTPDPEEISIRFDKVRQRLLQAYESRQAQPWFFPLITLYNVVLLAAFVFFVVYYKLIPGQPNLESTAYVALACAVWGGIGGVADAFFAVHTHLSRQDFDRHYWPWYYLHPLLGLSMGAVVYLILQAGLLAMSGTPLQEASANVTANATGLTPAAEPAGKIGVTALPIVLAFLAGFRQNTAVDFLTRIIQTVFQRQESGK